MATGLVLGGRLDHADARVVGRGHTSERLRALSLCAICVSQLSPPTLLALARRFRERGPLLTLRYSFVASWYSLCMVEGAGPAKARMAAKMPNEATRPRTVYRMTFWFSSAGSWARGPWAPKAIQ